MSFAAFMDDFATNCDDLDAFSDAVTKYDVQFDSVLLSLLDRIAQVSRNDTIPSLNTEVLGYSDTLGDWKKCHYNRLSL